MGSQPTLSTSPWLGYTGKGPVSESGQLPSCQGFSILTTSVRIPAGPFAAVANWPHSACGEAQTQGSQQNSEKEQSDPAQRWESPWSHSLESEKAEVSWPVVTQNGTWAAASHWALTRQQRQFSGGGVVFSTNGARTTGHSHYKKRIQTLNLLLKKLTYWNINLNAKCEQQLIEVPGRKCGWPWVWWQCFRYSAESTVRERKDWLYENTEQQLCSAKTLLRQWQDKAQTAGKSLQYTHLIKGLFPKHTKNSTMSKQPNLKISKWWEQTPYQTSYTDGMSMYEKVMFVLCHQGISDGSGSVKSLLPH